MIDCISVENMRLSDAYTIENFVPSLTLMYRAAWGVYLAHKWVTPVSIVVGSGNNGGDGYALACILKEKTIDCRIFTLSSSLTKDSAYYAGKAHELMIPISPFVPGCLQGSAIVVDCLLGTGFQGKVRECYRTAIEEINGAGAYVVSVDINSGMNGDTGECEIAVHSDLTVTIGFVKKGLISVNAGKFMKRLVCVNIGILLAKDEEKITQETCPSWLDMNIIDAIV